MQPITVHTGLVLPMDRANVDTDQLMPKQFLKRIERTGFGEFLFFDWRYLPDGSDNPEFDLNRPEYKGASILLARDNFGSGSSREHAPWGLADYGFRVLIAPSFGDIFYSNSMKNGILPVKLESSEVDELFRRAAEHPGYTLTVDLTKCEITDEHGLTLSFTIDPFRRECLLKGLDDIGLTLRHEQEITAYESAHGIGGEGTA